MATALIVFVVLVVVAGGRLRDILGRPLGRAWMGAGWAWMAGVVGAVGALSVLPGATAPVTALLCLGAGGVAALLRAGATGRRLIGPLDRRLGGTEAVPERRRLLLDELDAIEARREPDHPLLDGGLAVGGAVLTALGLAAGSAVLVGLGGSLLVVPAYTGARWLAEGRSHRELRTRLLPLAAQEERVPDPSPLAVSGRGVGDRRALAGRERFVLQRVAPGVREYEIVAGDDLVGELVGSTRRGFTASGECLGEAWDLQLRRRHFRLKGVEARMVRSGSDEVGATFLGSRYARGRVRLPDGRRMRWGYSPLGLGFPSGTRLVDRDGTGLLHYRAAFFRLLRGATRVHVSAEAWELEELPRLVLLTSFLRLHVESPFHTPFRRGG